MSGHMKIGRIEGVPTDGQYAYGDRWKFVYYGEDGKLIRLNRETGEEVEIIDRDEDEL